MPFPFAVVLEEIPRLLPILVDAVDQVLPHLAVDLSNARIVPVVQPARPEDHVIDGQPDRPSPVVVQSAVLAVPKRERPDSALRQQLRAIAHDAHQLGQDCLDGLALFGRVEFFPEDAGEEGEEIDVAHAGDELVHVLVFGGD